MQKYLNSAYRADKLIDSKQRQLESLRDISTGLSGGQNSERVQSGGGPDKIGEIVAKIVDLSKEINGDIDKYVDLKKEIMQNIDKLEDGDQVTLLYKRYLEFKPWEYVAVEMQYSLRQVFRIHKQALKKMALNGSIHL